MNLGITIPRRLYEKFVKKGVDVESFIIDALSGQVNLDPEDEVEVHTWAPGRIK